VTGQQLLLLLWTLWLVVALLAVGGRPGVILTLAVGGLSLGLVPAGVMSWRAVLMGGLGVAVLAAAARAYSQLRRPAQSARPEHPASVQPGLSRPLAAWVEHWPAQVMSASVSLAGLIWLLILRPSVPWRYPADITIMIGTVAALLAVEYRCWRLYENVNRRLAVTGQQLEAERKLRQESDAQNIELERRFQQATADRSQRQSELQQAQSELQQAQSELQQAQSELQQAQSELQEAQSELQEARARPLQVQAELREASESEGPPNDYPVRYRRENGANSGAEPGHRASPGPVRIDLIRIRELTSRDDAFANDPARPVGIILERSTIPVPPKPGETAGELTRRAEALLGHLVDNYAAQTIGEPAWNAVSKRWLTKGNGFDAAASSVEEFDSAVHNILLNQPVQLACAWAGLPAPAARALGGVAGAAGLPIDPLLNAVTRVIQIGGIVVGAVSGNPVLLSACFKSLAHDEFVRGLAAGIKTTLQGRELSAADQQRVAVRHEPFARTTAVRETPGPAAPRPAAARPAARPAVSDPRHRQSPERNAPTTGPGLPFP
jgi:hypothetical protein